MSAMEVIISVVILAFAVLPMINMMVSGRKNAAFTEYQVLAQLRARRILEVFSSHPYEALLNSPRAPDGGLKLPFDDNGFPPEYHDKLERYDEVCSFEEKKPGLGLMRVEIIWSMSGGDERRYILDKLFYDECLSLTDEYPLRQRGDTFVK